MTVVASTLMRTLCATIILFTLLIAFPVGAAPAAVDVGTGILVVTPDRGFLGNEEVRDAFDEFAKDRNAELLFVTDSRSEKILDQALSTLRQNGAQRLKVLPLVMSDADARWKLARDWLRARAKQGALLSIAPPYGASYLAVEDLSARLRVVHTDKRRLLLIGYGAGNADDAATMRDALKRMAGFASILGPDAIDVVVYPARKAADADALRRQVTAAVRGAHGTLVVPVGFAPRDDSMMTFSGWFSDDLPANAQLVGSPIANKDALAQWMSRAANETGMEFAPPDPSQIGIVALAHGADWFWNREIEQALAPVAARHKLAYAFSMADPPVVERAVRELENEHARAIVVVRAFGMASSFQSSVERMIGADVEAGGAAHAGHGMSMMHGGMAKGDSLAATPRIRSALPMVTVGGVNADPLFAKALLQNARSVSKHPSKETVILVAHGQGEDAANQRWLDLLDSVAQQMRADGGDKFRAIRYATWREDWPDKNEVAVKQVRAMVQQADRDGGRALIVPARINGRGAANRYLTEMDYGWSQGFAQTPYFAQWFEQQVARGIEKLHHGAETQMSAAGTHTH